MQVSKNMVVAIDYTLTDVAGEILDTSDGNDPLSYLHGVGNLLPGLEVALEGKSAGQQLQVTIPPSQGYGERNEQLRQTVSRENFADVDDIAIGMQFQVDDDDGDTVVTVVEIDDDNVTLDANHELAGMTLHFDVTVREVREATAEELEHGHAHEPGCDH